MVTPILRSKAATNTIQDSIPVAENWIDINTKSTQVLPGLYIGNFRDSKDQEQLRSNNITHIISIHDNARKVHQDKEYLCIQASDSPRQNISQFFSQSNDFIHSARTSGGNVLIHCLAGVSRSVTLAVAYIMSITSLSWRDALKALRGARSIANPNFGFQKQLADFESRNVQLERKRLRSRYPNSGFKQDEAECRQLLISYHNTVRPMEPCASICRRNYQRPGMPPPSPSRATQSQPPTPQTPTRSFAPQIPSSPRRRMQSSLPSSPRRYPRRKDGGSSHSS